MNYELSGHPGHTGQKNHHPPPVEKNRSIEIPMKFQHSSIFQAGHIRLGALHQLLPAFSAAGGGFHSPGRAGLVVDAAGRRGA